MAASPPPEHIHIDQTQTDPAKMITGDVQGKTITAIKEGSNCFVMKPEGDSWGLYRLSKTSRTQYADGTDASADIKQYDVMMRLPEFWYRGTEGDQVDIYFETTQPSDPENWVHWDGNVLIGCYEANYDSTNGLRSISGVASSGAISQSDFKAYAEAKGTGFQLVDWEMQNVMAILFYAWYGNTNAQAICGSGTSSYTKETGQTNSLGMTDTTTENGNSMSINFWGLENWWGNKWEWMQDVKTSGAGIIVDTPASGGNSRRLDFTQLGNGYYPSKMKFGKYCDCVGTAINGATTSGYCDYQYALASYGRVTKRSGPYSSSESGLVCVNASNNPSLPDATVGSRLCYRGPFIIHN